MVVGDKVELKVSMKDTQVDSSYGVGLGTFLQRPVRIASLTWEDNQQADILFEPWHLFFSNPAIASKLNNYYMLRANLRVKVVINASPFYYGAALCSYRPMSDISDGLYNPCSVPDLANIRPAGIVGRSQRPSFMIYPQSSQGGEMQLPFLYHQNWLDVTSAIRLKRMGTMAINSFDVLRFASASAGSGASIQVYAWAEDVELAGPTVDMAVQSKDEYSHEGLISKPASAVQRYVGLLSSVPVIGPFATATSFAAGAVSDIAKLFGYTNVPVIDDVHDVKVQPFPHMSSTDIGTPVEKLTLDSKNELTIDPRVTGVDTGDELLISKWTTRESFYDDFLWDASDPTDKLLYNLRVNPRFAIPYNYKGSNGIQPTPMWMVNKLFNYWRGDIIVRFNIICSKYHRGRLLISWDPKGAISTTTDTTNTVYTKIIDISDCTDVEFCIPYTQPTSYLPTLQTDFKNSDPSVPFTKTASDNGILTVRVLNIQTSPIETAPITILTFIKGADNLEFADPSDRDLAYDAFDIQSLDITAGEKETYEMGLQPSMATENLNLIHMGETIVSLRTLLRRPNFVGTLTAFTPEENQRSDVTFLMRRLPLYPGYDPNGINQVSGLPDDKPYNFVHYTTLNWINQCFVGNRGAIMWHYNVYSTEGDLQSVDATRRVEEILSSAAYQKNTNIDNVNINFINKTAITLNSSKNSGMSLTNQRTQSGVSISAPNYSQYRFLSNAPNQRTLGSSVDDTTRDSIKVTCKFITGPDDRPHVCAMDSYVSIGTDFTPVFFLNVPFMWIRTNPIPVV